MKLNTMKAQYCLMANEHTTCRQNTVSCSYQRTKVMLRTRCSQTLNIMHIYAHVLGLSLCHTVYLNHNWTLVAHKLQKSSQQQLLAKGPLINSFRTQGWCYIICLFTVTLNNFKIVSDNLGTTCAVTL
jgi:hypothetical protein